jgi:hypothetical protein
MYSQMRAAVVVYVGMLRARCAGRVKVGVVLARGGPATTGNEEKVCEILRGDGARGDATQWRV